MCTDSLTILYVKKITVRCAWLVHEKMKDCQTQNILSFCDWIYLWVLKQLLCSLKDFQLFKEFVS